MAKSLTDSLTNFTLRGVQRIDFTWGGNFFLPPQVNSLPPHLFSHLTWDGKEFIRGGKEIKIDYRQTCTLNKRIICFFTMTLGGWLKRVGRYGQQVQHMGQVQFRPWEKMQKARATLQNNLLTSPHLSSWSTLVAAVYLLLSSSNSLFLSLLYVFNRPAPPIIPLPLS